MDKITVSELKAKLEQALENLECYEDNDVVSTSCNTYGMRGWVLEVPRIGFVNIMDIEVEEQDEEEDY